MDSEKNETEKNPSENTENNKTKAPDEKETEQKAEENKVKETEKTEEKKAEAKKEEQPKVIDVQPVNAPKEKKTHHFGWDTFGKICAVAILAFACGFGGGVAAVKTVGENEKEERVQEFSSGNMPDFQMPSEGGNSDSSSGSGSGSDHSDSPFSSSAVIGITVQQKADANDSSKSEVVVVAVNDKSNADEAGIQVGDVITRIDDEAVTSVSGLSEYVSNKSVGDKVTLTYERDGKEGTAEVELVDSSKISDNNNAA
ncbi:MAG: PDZ domain-containing protein [Solobacterium sp.]|nr:PDZ domain-containing protein [Solobacterium sp.]MCH4048558.1 PDZ domain-containing protein [Solobacterium sp.]MCH4074592.1 PDZ domain-containing protein [Solobacterium sp.]MCI1314713.1 PDZ domain-containing protein [Solobacterium sp.]MCI1347007.1 PDZ domain-containing protein [Solobacterium sp.]